MKKGQIEVSQVIGLIMAIIGFVVVLILLFSLELNNYSSDEVCHASVLGRASVPLAAQNYVPLKCTTGKICITDKSFGGKCEQFLGESDVAYVRLEGTPGQKATQIEEVNAEALYNCWNLMGEGKIDIFRGAKTGLVDSISGFDNIKQKSSTCVVCARVAIDEDFIYKNKNNKNLGLSDNFLDVSKEYDFNDYLVHHAPEGSELSYLNLFTDRQVRAYPAVFASSLSTGDKTGTPTPIDQKAIIFMQIVTKTNEEDAFLQSGGKFFSTGQTALASTGNTFNPEAQVFAAISAAGYGGIAAYQTYQSREVSANYCGKFSQGGSNENPRNGCSIFAVIDYNNIEKVNKFCSVIEGSP